MHLDRIRFAGKLVLVNSTVAAEGMDVGEVSADGNLSRIVGFLGPMRADK